jgi:uncharacterized protein YkwD
MTTWAGQALMSTDIAALLFTQAAQNLWGSGLSVKITALRASCNPLRSNPGFSGRGLVPMGRLMKAALFTFLAAGSMAVSASACPQEPRWKDQLIEQINAMRAHGGVCTGGARFSPAQEGMRWNEALESAAQAQSEWMSQRGELSHVGPQGEGLGERVRQFAYAFARVGENVAMGYADMGQVVQAWRASEKHCQNMLDPRLTEVALACVRGRNGPFWTITLARPAEAPRLAHQTSPSLARVNWMTR